MPVLIRCGDVPPVERDSTVRSIRVNGLRFPVEDVILVRDIPDRRIGAGIVAVGCEIGY
jgi:hypothetical protein